MKIQKCKGKKKHAMKLLYGVLTKKNGKHEHFRYNFMIWVEEKALEDFGLTIILRYGYLICFKIGMIFNEFLNKK